MESTTLSEDQTTMRRECLSQQQKGLINCLLQSMSLPIAMIGNSFQLHAASYPNERKGKYRISAAMELTSNNNKKCPAPTHPCREPPKSEQCIDEEEEEDECCEEEDDYDECEEEEEEDECCCIDEREDDDCLEEEEEDCIEEEEEEDCVEEEEEECVEEEEEEDCVEEEEDEECIEEEDEEEEDCIEEEEEEEEECIEEEEEEECVEEEKEIPKPKCPSPIKKSTEKETQTSGTFTEKICNGKRQICLEAPPECKDEKTETKKEVTKDAKREALCKRDYKQHIDCGKKTTIDDKCKKEPQVREESRERETRCKKKPMKDSNSTKEPKKKADCKKESKKNQCCDGDFYEKEAHRKKSSRKDQCCDGDSYEKETRRKKNYRKDDCCDGDSYEKEARRKKTIRKDESCDRDFQEKETHHRKSCKKDESCDRDFHKKENRNKKVARKNSFCDGDYEKKTSRKKSCSRKDDSCEGDYKKEAGRRKVSMKDDCYDREHEKKTYHKKVPKKDECFDEDFEKQTMEEPKKKKCSKDRGKTDNDEKDKNECKKEAKCDADCKKQSDCYAEEELKKICRKYRNYDCIPPWLGDAKKSRRSNSCSPSKRGCQDDREEKKCYQKQFTRDCCHRRDEVECEEVEEECVEDEDEGPEYHPDKKGCSSCERFNFKKEEKHQPKKENGNNQNYYCCNKFGQGNLKTWEKCSGDTANTIRNIAKSKSKEYIYNQIEANNRSLYTESNCYMHSPKFETMEGGSIKSEYHTRRNTCNTLGTYTCPNVNNNYNGYVVQNDDVYTPQGIYTANEEPHYTSEVLEAASVPLAYSSGASNYDDYSVKNCSFSQICYGDTSRLPREDCTSSADEDEDTAFSEAIEKKDGAYDNSYCSGRDTSVRCFSICDDDSFLDEVGEKYKQYGQANAGDDDDYYTTHSKGSNYCPDVAKPGIPVASHSLDNQVYTTRIQSPVQKLARRKSPAPSMFDVEHLIIDSMSEASNDSCVDSENEAKHKAIHKGGDDRSFTSSFSHFTNSPLENLKRVIATIKKRALGIEDDMPGNVVETVQAKEMDVNSVYEPRKQTCDEENSDKSCHSTNDIKRKRTPQFLVPPERKPKPVVQLINQTVSRHPFQSKCEVVECNNDNRPTKSNFLVPKSARTQKAGRSIANQDVINHIAKVLTQPEHRDAEIENLPESNLPTVCTNASSDPMSTILCVDNEEIFLEKPSQPIAVQSVNYVDKRVAKKTAYSERPASRIKSYSTTPSIGRSAHFQKPNSEKQKPQGKTKAVKESSTRARSPSRAKSYVKGSGFQFRQLANKKEELDKKGKASEKDSKKLEFIHVPEPVAKSLPFFKSEDASSKDLLDRASVEMPTILIDNVAEESKTTNKGGPRVFKSLSKENGQSTKSVAKFMKTKVEKTPAKSANTQHKKVDISGDLPTSSFPWRSPHVITIGPMNNGQKLYNYRKSQKKRDADDSVDPVPEVISPASSIGEDLDEFHDRIISMEMCDSAKMIRKKIRQVNYIPDRTIYEASESSEDDDDDDDDDDDRSSKSSIDEHSSSDAWYCDVPVNIVRTQELYRNQKKTNSIMDEIISLTKQRSVSDDIAHYLTEEEQAFENGDYFEENTEGGRSLLEASHRDQSNTSTTKLNVDSEDYNTSPYNKVYTQKVQEDTVGKQAVKDTETFLSFNKSMIHHIGRILCKKDDDDDDKDEDDDEDGVIPECESPFEVSGNEEINYNLNSLQGSDEPADSEGNVQKSNSADSLFRHNPSPNNTGVETQLRKCAFKLDSPQASQMAELENTAQMRSSPPVVFPNKLPFQSPANAYLIATNKLARSNSELYLSMKEQERASSAKLKEQTGNVQKNSGFNRKPGQKKERRNTAPLSTTKDFKSNKPAGFERRSPKKYSIWAKLSRERLVDSKSKLSLDRSGDHRKTKAETEAMQAKTGPRHSSHSLKQRSTSPGASVSNEKQLRSQDSQTNTSKSLPHVFTKNNKFSRSRSRNQVLTKGNSPVTGVQNAKASPSPSSTGESKSVPVSRSPSSVLSNKIPATVLTPSTPENEPKRRKAAREMQSKKDSPGLRRKKNKIKSIVEKMEQKKVSHEDHFKLITNRSQESLRSKSGTEMLQKKIEKFKQLVDAKRFKEAIPGKGGAIVAVITTETEAQLREKKRQKYERPDEWKNKGKTTRAAEGKEDAKNPDLMNESKTMSTQTQDTQTNAGEGDVKKVNETKKLTDSQKKYKTATMERKVVDKSLLSSKSNEIKKEESNPALETKKEELNIPNNNTTNETKAEEPKSYAERRLQELRKKYQRSIVDKKATPENSFEHITSTVASSVPKQEVKPEEAWKIRMQELKKEKRGAFEEKRALAKANSGEVKPVELTSMSETPAPVVEDTVPKSLPERRVQEWRQKYQPSLVKRFSSKTDISKEESNKKSQVKVKGQMVKLTKGRRYSLEARKARLLASDSDLSMEPIKPIVRRHFRSLAKTDIFGIPQAAGKHPSVVKQQTRALRSRSRSRSTSRTNLLSPKLKKKQQQQKQQKQPEPPKVPYIPPTILEVKSEPAEKANDAEKATEKVAEKATEKAPEKNEKPAEKPSVEPENAQERAKQPRGTTAYKIGKGPAGKPVNIKKNNLQSSKQQDVGLLNSAVEAVEDAVNSMAVSMPTLALLPSTMSDQKAALEEMKANKNAAAADEWIRPSMENEVENKETIPKKAEPVVKKEVVRRVRRDGQTSYAIKKDIVENSELVRENVIASDLKLTRTVTPDFNYEKKYETPSIMNQNTGKEHKFTPPPPQPKPFFNNPKPAENEEDDYLKYADFRQQISQANRPNPRRPVYEPKLASHKFSKPLNPNRNEIYQKQAYKISNNEPAQPVRTKTSNQVVPPTVLSAPAKSVATEPEKAKPPPKTKTPSPPASAPKAPSSAPIAQTDNLITDVSKSTFGMFTKLINTITRTSVFEENDAEKPKNKNSNAVAESESNTHCQWFLNMDKDMFILPEDEPEGYQLKRIDEGPYDLNNSNSVLLGIDKISIKTDPLLFDWDDDINCNNSAESPPDPKKANVKVQRQKRGKLSKESHDKRSMVTGSSAQEVQPDNANKIISETPSTSPSNIQDSHWDSANNVKAEKLSLTSSDTSDDQFENVKKIKDEHQADQRLKRCYSSLGSCCESDSASLTTLNTLIEWNFVLMCVILLLLFGTFSPGSLRDLFWCPLPSLYNGLYNAFLASIGINLFCWSQPARSSVWSIFARKEARPGLFYSFIYQVIDFLTRLMFFMFRHFLIPIISIPFIVFGPVVNVLVDATLCTLGYLLNEFQTFVLALTKSNSAATGSSTTTIVQNTNEVTSFSTTEESDGLLHKLQEIQQYASFFIYLGPNTAKKQCAYSVLTSFYLWLTNQTPAECM